MFKEQPKIGSGLANEFDELVKEEGGKIAPRRTASQNPLGFGGLKTGE